MKIMFLKSYYMSTQLHYIISYTILDLKAFFKTPMRRGCYLGAWMGSFLALKITSLASKVYHLLYIYIHIYIHTYIHTDCKSELQQTFRVLKGWIILNLTFNLASPTSQKHLICLNLLITNCLQSQSHSHGYHLYCQWDFHACKHVNMLN